MAEMPERFNCVTVTKNGETFDDMRSSPTGEWMRYGQHAEIVAALNEAHALKEYAHQRYCAETEGVIAALTNDVTVLRKALEEIRDWYADGDSMAFDTANYTLTKEVISGR